MTAGLAERRAARTVLPVPEPDLTPAELIARAAALKPLLHQQQAENDERGFYSQELHQAFLDAGLIARCSRGCSAATGFDPTFTGHAEISWPSIGRLVHRLCVASTSHRLALVERAQRGCSGRTGTCGAAPRAPAGMLAPAEGGYRLTACGISAQRPSFHAPRLRRGWSPTDRRRCFASRCRARSCAFSTIGAATERSACAPALTASRSKTPHPHGASREVPLQGLFTAPKTCATARREHSCTAIRCTSDASPVPPHVADHAGHQRRQGGARRLQTSPHQEHQLSADRPARRARGFSARARPRRHSDDARNLMIRGGEATEMCSAGRATAR